MKRTATYTARPADKMSAGWSCARGSLHGQGFALATLAVEKPVNRVILGLSDASEPGDRVG